MKAKILKIAGVKSEKEFYKKYPSEEAFMKVHGKEFKKALLGAKLTTAQGGLSGLPGDPPVVNPDPIAFNLMGDPSIPRQYDPIPMMQSKGFTPLAVPALQNAKLAPNNHAMQSGIMGKVKQMANLPGQIAEGVTAIKKEKEDRQKAERWRDVSKVTLAASQSQDVDINRQLHDNMTRKREMMMPVNTGEEFFPIYGVGTNPLAKNGKKIKGKKAKGEIMNVYNNPNVPIAAGGFTSFLGGGGDQLIGNATATLYGENAGSKLGGDLGGTVGNLFGPVGGLVGKEVGKLAGFAFDRNPAKMKAAQGEMNQNMAMMGINNGMKGVQGQYTSYMEDGGYVSNNWTPQVITKFGEHRLSDLLKPDPTMDTLRTGGSLRQNETMNGELQTHWGGYAEPISENPYLPDGGRTVMFRGNSHEESAGNGRTGIGITFGNNPVEVEGGEPAVKLADGGTDENLTVFGNMPIGKSGASLLGDPDASNMKFKGYANSLAKKTDRVNKLVDDSIEKINDLQVATSFDKLALSGLSANVMGSNMKLKEYADKTQKAASLQQAINDTADEYGIVADDLAKGKIKKAAGGTTIGGILKSAGDFATTTLPLTMGNFVNQWLEDQEKLKHVTPRGFVPAKNMKEVWQHVIETPEENRKRREQLPVWTPPTTWKDAWRDAIGTRYEDWKSPADTIPKKADGDNIPLVTQPENGGYVNRFFKEHLPKVHQYGTMLGAMTNANPFTGIEIAAEMTGAPGLYRYMTGEDQDPGSAVGNVVGSAATALGSRIAGRIGEKVATTKLAKQQVINKSFRNAHTPEDIIEKTKPTRGKINVTEDFNKWKADQKAAKPTASATATKPAATTKPAGNKLDTSEAEILASPPSLRKILGWSLGAGAAGAGLLGGSAYLSGKVKGPTLPPLAPVAPVNPVAPRQPGDNPYLNELGNREKLAGGKSVAKQEKDTPGVSRYIPSDRRVNPFDPWIYNLPQPGWRMPGMNNWTAPEAVAPAAPVGTGAGKGGGKKAVALPVPGEIINLPEYTHEMAQNDIIAPVMPTNSPYTDESTGVPVTTEDDKWWWINALNSMIPYFRPSDAENLDPRQLAGEMYALSSNQLQPVQAQTYQPQLKTPYDMSFQDQLNEIHAQTRAAQKTVGYNPAAQASIAAQAYGPESNVLAGQFRANQQMKDQTYAQNLGTLNDAQLKNIGIFDQQYQRQEAAKSATKATTMEALKSISDKYLKNQSEQRTLQTYENMYGYRFGPRMQAINWNAPAQFNTEGNSAMKTGALPEGYEYVYNAKSQPIDIRKSSDVNTPIGTKRQAQKRNGSIVRAFRDL